MKNIWYPGSSYADEKWIKYLQNTFKGRWIFADTAYFSDWKSLPGERKKFDTFNFTQLNMKVDILIISSHPDLKTTEEVVANGILDHVRPQKFIYDPGTNKEDIHEHINATNLLANRGYSCKHIIVLPSLLHQYCEFDRRLFS